MNKPEFDQWLPKYRQEYPEESYGWHIFLAGESGKPFEPKRNSDEYTWVRYDGTLPCWRMVPTQSKEFFNDYIYRRRVDVGEGYRLVGLDEMPQEGDEVFDPKDEAWITSHWHERYQDQNVLQCLKRCNYSITFRRKIAAEKPADDLDGWLPIRNTKGEVVCPKATKKAPIQIWHIESDVIAVAFDHFIKDGFPFADRSDFDSTKCTHWKPLELSKPPKIKSECDKEFEAYLTRGGYVVTNSEATKDGVAKAAWDSCWRFWEAAKKGGAK